MAHPTQLRISIGGYFGASYSVELENVGVRYRASEQGQGRIDERFDPTDSEWRRFALALEQAGVWEWESDYYEPATDGTSWSLEISWDGRTITSQGSNAFPASFEAFLAAVSRLAGARPFE